MVGAPEACDGRTGDRCHESEGVKEGKDAQHAVGLNEGVDVADLFDVTDQVAMAQHDSFWLSRASTTEDDRSKIIRASLGATQEFQETVRRGAFSQESRP